MRSLSYPLFLTLMGLAVAAVMGVLGAVTGGGTTAGAPRSFAVAFNFGGPSTVLFCWVQPDAKEVTSYDMLVTHWNFGRTRTEVSRDISTADCAGSVGTAHLFPADNLYHVAVRACRHGRCSNWADTTGALTYWLRIPCAEPSGRGCAYPESGDTATGRVP